MTKRIAVKTTWFIQGKSGGKLHHLLNAMGRNARADCGRYFEDAKVFRVRTAKGQDNIFIGRLCENCFGGGYNMQGVFDPKAHRAASETSGAER